MHKETVWRWGGSQQKVFDELKRRFVEGPILVAADYMCPVHVEPGASDFATGAVLSMLCEDEKWHPCAFLSKDLNDIKMNYNMHNKELYKHWRCGDIIWRELNMKLTYGLITKI